MYNIVLVSCVQKSYPSKYTYIIFRLFSITGYYKGLNIQENKYPVLYRRFLLFSYFIHSYIVSYIC